MKLAPAQILHVERQLAFLSVAEDHPVIPELTKTFGDHTFFVNTKGLNIVELDSATGGASCVIFKLASWTNEQKSELAPHDPELQSAAIDIVLPKPDPTTW